MPKVYYNKAAVFVIECSLNSDMFITWSTGEVLRAFLRIKKKAIKEHSVLGQSLNTTGAHDFYVEILERLDCQAKFEMIASEATYIKIRKPIQHNNTNIEYYDT